MIMHVTALSIVAVVAQPNSTERDDLVRAVLATWPDRGVITCEYRVVGLASHWRKRVSYHFGSGAWAYWTADGKNGSSGVTPSGAYYSGDVKFEFRTHDAADHSASLDLYFPSFSLLKHLERTDAVRAIRRRPDGGYEIECALPRGQRTQTMAQLPTALVDSLGGPEAVMKTVTFEVDAALHPIVRHCKDQPDQVFTLSDCGAGGFTVSQKCPWPVEEVELISCTYQPDGTAAAFGLSSAQSAFTTWQRAHAEVRTPIGPRTDSASGQTPLSTDIDPPPLSHRPLPWLLAGGTVAVLGVLAWMRRRADRA